MSDQTKGLRRPIDSARLCFLLVDSRKSQPVPLEAAQTASMVRIVNMLCLVFALLAGERRDLRSLIAVAVFYLPDRSGCCLCMRDPAIGIHAKPCHEETAPTASAAWCFLCSACAANGAVVASGFSNGLHQAPNSRRLLTATATQTASQCQWSSETNSCDAADAVNIMYAVRGQPVSPYLW